MSRGAVLALAAILALLVAVSLVLFFRGGSNKPNHNAAVAAIA